MMTWYIGMATMVMIGLFKVAFSFVGQWVQRVVPQAGLLGSLAGIGIALIGLTPLVDIFGTPVASGTYGGGTITVPMNGVTPPQPIGGAFKTLIKTGPNFDVFIVTSAP